MRRWIAWMMVLAAALTATCHAEFSEDYVLTEAGGWQTAAESSGVMIVGYSSSGDLRDKYGVYSAANAFDCDRATTWAEDRDGNGDGAWLQGEWQVLDGRWSVTGVMLRGGYHKSRDVFGKNARPRTVELEIAVDGGEPADYLVTLNDSMNSQYIVFGAPLEASGAVRARLTLWGAYPGGKYADTCVSEFDLLVAPLDGGDAAPGAWQSGGWFDAPDAAPSGETLAGLFHRLTGDMTYTEYPKGDADRQSVFGTIEGVETGASAAFALNGAGTARALLQGILDESWFNEEHTGAILPLLNRAQSVRLVQSELHAWGMEDGRPLSADEYYRFELVTAEGASVSLLANTGYETDGGDWADAVIIP